MNAQRQFVLGIFFVLALSILAFYTLFLTDFTLFGDQIQIDAEFPEAHQLRVGDPVLVAGTRVGRVKEITFLPDAQPDRRIVVAMNLDRQLNLLEGYSITIEESTFLGGRNIDIDPGPPDAPPAVLLPSGRYVGDVRPNPIASLEPVGELIRVNADSVTSFLTNLDLLLKDVRGGEGLASRILYDGELAANVSAAAEDLRGTSADLRAMMTQLRDVVSTVERGEGTIGKLLRDDELHGQALATISSLQAITADLQAGEGTIGALLNDDPLAEELRGIVTDISGITRGLQAGDGLLGGILKDPELRAELDLIMVNVLTASEGLRDLGTTLQSKEGSLGLLLNDRELYDEALISLKLLTRSLEDYREAAPVSAFTSALLGVF